MTDREYLRSLGFTVGERGRFSKEMLEALANRDTATAANAMNEVRQTLGLPTQTVQRDAQELYGVTLGGHKVGFIMCSRCAEHMIWCMCDGGPVAPDNVAMLTGAAKSIAQLHPRMLSLSTH